jgi:hypothetical protein
MCDISHSEQWMDFDSCVLNEQHCDLFTTSEAIVTQQHLEGAVQDVIHRVLEHFEESRRRSNSDHPCNEISPSLKLLHPKRVQLGLADSRLCLLVVHCCMLFG